MLDIQPASESQREAAYRNVHDVWSGGRPLDEHVRLRLSSPKHRRATWFVGCEDGRVVTSLGCYPLEFRIAGETVSGVAIGSVHTLAACRGRGFASQLVTWVDNYQRTRGVRLSLLYSDISVDFYQRLGYVSCPSLAGWAEPRFNDGSQKVEQACNDALIQFEPAAALQQMAGLYARYHGQLPISIARGDDYWRHLLERQAGDEFFWLGNPSQEALGYVWLSTREETLKISDYALATHDETLARRLYAAVIAMGATRGMKRVGGWLPRTAATQELFRLSVRRQEITMLKSLDTGFSLDADMLAATDRFSEIDHV